MIVGVAMLLAVLGCLFPGGAAADSTQSVAVTFNLCPGSGPSACNGLKIYIDSASNHYRPSDRYSYCTKDETSTGFTPKYNGEARHVSMILARTELRLRDRLLRRLRQGRAGQPGIQRHDL